MLRERIRERKDVLLIGVDVAKRKHVASLCGPFRKMLVPTYGFFNSRSGFEDFRNMVKEVQDSYGFNDVVVGLESTGLYKKSLEGFLWASGYHVVSV